MLEKTFFMNSDWRQNWNPLFVSWSHALWDVCDQIVSSSPQLSCRKENIFLLRGMKNSFSYRRVFGRVANKDVELCLVLSCRKSSRVVVRVVTVTNFDQVNSTLQYITFRKHHNYTYHPSQICPLAR